MNERWAEVKKLVRWIIRKAVNNQNLWSLSILYINYYKYINQKRLYHTKSCYWSPCHESMTAFL